MTSAKSLMRRVRRNSQARFCRRVRGSDSPFDSSGIALLKDTLLIWIAELTHRGQAIQDALLSRRQLRRGRRNRQTRYRKARFLNRTRPEGWLAPSLQHRVETILTWINRLDKLAPIGSVVQELVKFDLQLMQNAEISGVEYQQGELQGYEVREYLLEVRPVSAKMKSLVA